MKRRRLSDEQITAIVKEQEAGAKTAVSVVWRPRCQSRMRLFS